MTELGQGGFQLRLPVKKTPHGFTSMLQSLLEELLLSPERRDFSQRTSHCTAAFSVENGVCL